MNIKPSLIWELMLYECELSQNVVEVTKNICCKKSESTVDYSTVTKWFKKFCSHCKNLNNQAKLGEPKTVDFEAVLQAIEANLVSSTQRVWGKLGI